MIDSYFAGLVVTALLLFVGHWFPWPCGDLHRLLSYGYGVGSLLIGLGIWLAPYETFTATGMFLWLGVVRFAVVAGLATGAAWFVDWVLGLWTERKVNERRAGK